MSGEKIKFYKNPQRVQNEVAKSYTPQYQSLGLEPQEHKGAVASAIAAPSTDNPRAHRAHLQQSYVEPTPSPLGRGKGAMLNVGNNIEHAWSSGVDDQIIDDLDDTSLDPNHPMVDNNDFVSNSALGLSGEDLPVLDEVANPPRKRFTRDEVSAAFQQGYSGQTRVQVITPAPVEDLISVLQDLEEGTYLVLVDGVPVCSGPVEEVQEQARLLVFGEHEICAGNPVSVDDIIIIKKTKIKVGLFLE